MTTMKRGKSAPDFSLKDTDSKSWTLAEIRKRGPVLLAFYKVSCPVCQYTFPFLERIHKAYGNEKVTVIGVSQDDARTSREFMRECGCTFPALLDEGGYPVSNTYGLTTVPTVLLIEADGTVRSSETGFSREQLNEISSFFAQHLGTPAKPVFHSGESVPEYKPG